MLQKIPILAELQKLGLVVAGGIVLAMLVLLFFVVIKRTSGFYVIGSSCGIVLALLGIMFGDKLALSIGFGMAFGLMLFWLAYQTDQLLASVGPFKKSK